MIRLWSLLICSALLLGCSATRHQSGDFTGFLRQQLLTRNAQVATNASLPLIRGTWTYEPNDDGGFHIFLRDHRLEEVDTLLTAALGEPQRKRDAQPGLKPIRIYHKRRVGVSLFIVGKTNGVWIGCTASQSQ